MKKNKINNNEINDQWLMINIFGYRKNIEVQKYNITTYRSYITTS